MLFAKNVPPFERRDDEWELTVKDSKINTGASARRQREAGDIYHTKVATTTCRRLSPGDRSTQLTSKSPSRNTWHRIQLITKLYNDERRQNGNTHTHTQCEFETSGLQKLFYWFVFQDPTARWSVASHGEQKQNYINIIMSACGSYNCFQHTKYLPVINSNFHVNLVWN